MTRNVSRRAFLRGAGQLGALGAAAPLGLGLAAATRASASTTDTAYKALVCVYLYGGNDSYNTVIPFDRESYSNYKNMRQGVAIAHEKLGATALQPNHAFTHGRQFALHPQLGGLKRLFDQNKLALAMNVGTLLQPTTLSQYHRAEHLPPALMSHHQQLGLWQSMLTEGARAGWGTRMGDIFASGSDQSNLLSNVSAPVSRNTPASASHVQLTSSSDVINLMVQDAPASAIGNTTLLRQLSKVARIISAQRSTQTGRQIFFVGLGGFDNHGSLNTDHPELLQELGDSMEAFQHTIDGMGMGRQVTTFTASDFGRALVSNGRGSDHGWGGHHFVMGGAVRSRHWVGALPSLQLGDADDVGQGRLLPAIGVDQYGANLAKWMGLSDSEVRDVFPNIGRFGTADLGLIDWSKAA